MSKVNEDRVGKGGKADGLSSLGWLCLSPVKSGMEQSGPI